ncbi:taurine ABC transporter substrate-binding protein [Reinekea marinisedimentorum]|uniref:Taurine transport system substrate-binding protein n=1 Tax=Reinekea marinisedimentorum TaxID=230495 RepID=A0A4R3IAW9_9GAMM|nr:taurine ABC transporter substrate-binding protein [Reinekea marinisedimentorum]TCS43124.1 taurine transport system substrate-binding protein [Reinekea marinisedimentorum]
MKKLSTLKRGLVAATLIATSTVTFAKEVTIGYQGMFNPWKHAIAEKILEEETGYEIKWRRFDSGAKAITAMASGAVAMTSAGSSPIAAAVSRGVEMELVWILENIAEAEALVVTDEIKTPEDLKGKRIAVPFVSTTHFHMLFALEHYGLTEKDVKLINMQPSAISAAWQRGDIDGAFIWDPALGTLKKTGHVLVSSKELAALGKPTFDGFVVNKKFGQEDPEFVAKVIKTMATLDAEYRDNKATFDASSPIAMSISKVTGGDINTVADVLALYDFPTMEQQLSCEWLGCGAEGAATKALKATSEFLLEQKKINELMPDYSVFVNPSFAEAASKL